MLTIIPPTPLILGLQIIKYFKIISENADLQEALLKSETEPPRSVSAPTIQRKVSFREHPTPSKYCPECHHIEVVTTAASGMASTASTTSFRRPLTPQSYNNGAMYPPITRAVVKTFSIDKLRPVCPVCNPVGSDTPYPKNNNFQNTTQDEPLEDPDDEVQRLNSELDELQKCLLKGTADLAQAEQQNQDLN